MKNILAFIALLLFSGCASPTPNFYQPVAMKTADFHYTQITDTILVKNILLPSEVSRPQITTVGRYPYELHIDEFNRWGATPDKLFQRIIAQDLSLYLPNATIEVQTSLKKNYKYAVSIEVNEMSGKLGKEAFLTAVYFLKNTHGITVRSGKINKTIPIQGGYDEYVLAQSELLGYLSAKIATDLAKLN